MATYQDGFSQSENQFPHIYNISENQTQLVNAFELHQTLQIQADFEVWFSQQATDYWFEEEVDFIFLEQVGCFVYLPMAMTLCNLAQSQIGKDTRYYFLAIDHQIRSGNTEQDIWQLQTIPNQ